LAGYLFTQDLDRALNVSEDLDVGIVGLNAGIVSDPATPFGGVKESGLAVKAVGSASMSSWSTS